MSKIFLFFTLSFLEVILFSLTSSPAFADDCDSFTFDPSDLKQDMTNNLKITASSKTLPGGNKYYMSLTWPENRKFDLKLDLYLDSNGKVTAEFKNSSPFWLAGRYTVKFGPDSERGTTKVSCLGTFDINEIPVQHSCTISITSAPSITPDTNISIKVADIAEGDYQILIYDQKGSEFRKFLNRITTTSSEFSLGAFPTGQYSVSVKDSPGTLEGKKPQLQCSPTSFTVNPRKVPDDEGPPAPAATACSGKDCSSGGGDPCTVDPKNPGFKTAIGCIHTNPAVLVKDLMTFVIGIGGGLAFLLMLMGAFQMLTSAGNPDHLNAGRERLTNAVIGLLFVIFAVLFLQIIGVGILAIPGFK